MQPLPDHQFEVLQDELDINGDDAEANGLPKRNSGSKLLENNDGANINNEKSEESAWISKEGYGTNEEFVIRLMGQDQGAHGKFNFSETLIHQLIETIEFVLGTVSNTASYLRLWALSLAHSQLAKVGFDLLLEPSLKSSSSVSLVINGLIWCTATLSVLLMMDVMECALHTLRLHWVEF
mmetsp:Transcript_18359/g.13225  ORF Transcript_18359/g.13225 Transcript_18359/m.13225 type:complete len:180 (+) Transcript_18359:2088-2627(+)